VDVTGCEVKDDGRTPEVLSAAEEVDGKFSVAECPTATLRFLKAIELVDASLYRVFGLVYQRHHLNKSLLCELQQLVMMS
jgi:hypothetical protein